MNGYAIIPLKTRDCAPCATLMSGLSLPVDWRLSGARDARTSGHGQHLGTRVWPQSVSGVERGKGRNMPCRRKKRREPGVIEVLGITLLPVVAVALVPLQRARSSSSQMLLLLLRKRRRLHHSR